MARFGAPDDPAARARRGVQAHRSPHWSPNPFMIAGTGRFCTAVMEIAAGKAIVKTGAEGVYMAAIAARRRLGIALKVEDGAARAAEVAMADAARAATATSTRTQLARLDALANPPLTNAAGLRIGKITPDPTF